MTKILTSDAIHRYEVQIKSAILLTALLLFIYSFKTQNVHTRGSQNSYEYKNTK